MAADAEAGKGARRVDVLRAHMRSAGGEGGGGGARAAEAGAQTMVVGACVLDVNAKAGTGRKVKAGGSVPGRVTQAMGGVARNIADGVARLGETAVPLLVSAVGDDAAGRALVDHWTALTGDLAPAVRVCAGIPSATVSAVFSDDGSLVACVADTDAAAAAVTPAWISRFQPALRSAGAVAVDCNLTPDALWCVATAAPRGALWLEPTSEAKSVRACAVLKHVSVASPNEAELLAMAAAVAGDSPALADDSVILPTPQETALRLASAARTLLNAGIAFVAVTIGASGVLLYDGDSCHHVPAVNVSRVVGVSGAGDAVAAGALTVLSTRLAPWRREDVLDGLALGVVVASKVVQMPGTHIPVQPGSAGASTRAHWRDAAAAVRRGVTCIQLKHS